MVVAAETATVTADSPSEVAAEAVDAGAANHDPKFD